jgi:3-hydroxyacyl-[acyl-carrier-protein] dehydratase
MKKRLPLSANYLTLASLMAHVLLSHLPHQAPFRFVDDILSVEDHEIRGQYQFREDEYFYTGHFPHQPITPGVILIECMAQIGLVCFGLHLLGDQRSQASGLAFTSSDVDFLLPVYPGERVDVHAEKQYFRLGKLKVSARMTNQQGDCVAKGTLAGIMRLSPSGRPSGRQGA